VAFDIDGTLYPNRSMYLHSALHGLTRPRFLVSFAKVRRQIRTIYPISDFEELQTELLADLMGISHEEAKRRIDEWMRVELDSVYRRLKPFPHLRECIEKLKSAGYRLGVLSDFPVGRKLEYLGLDGLWDCVISSHDVGYLKPRTEPFQAVADCLDVTAEHIVYIGNSYEYDIVGAADAGLKTAYFTQHATHRDKADIVFSDYRELFPAIVEFVRS